MRLKILNQIFFDILTHFDFLNKSYHNSLISPLDLGNCFNIMFLRIDRFAAETRSCQRCLKLLSFNNLSHWWSQFEGIAKGSCMPSLCKGTVGKNSLYSNRFYPQLEQKNILLCWQIFSSCKSTALNHYQNQPANNPAHVNHHNNNRCSTLLSSKLKSKTLNLFFCLLSGFSF